MKSGILKLFLLLSLITALLFASETPSLAKLSNVLKDLKKQAKKDKKRLGLCVYCSPNDATRHEIYTDSMEEVPFYWLDIGEPSSLSWNNFWEYDDSDDSSELSSSDFLYVETEISNTFISAFKNACKKEKIHFDLIYDRHSNFLPGTLNYLRLESVLKKGGSFIFFNAIFSLYGPVSDRNTFPKVIRDEEGDYEFMTSNREIWKPFEEHDFDRFLSIAKRYKKEPNTEPRVARYVQREIINKLYPSVPTFIHELIVTNYCNHYRFLNDKLFLAEKMSDEDPVFTPPSQYYFQLALASQYLRHLAQFLEHRNYLYDLSLYGNHETILLLKRCPGIADLGMNYLVDDRKATGVSPIHLILSFK